MHCVLAMNFFPFLDLITSPLNLLQGNVCSVSYCPDSASAKSVEPNLEFYVILPTLCMKMFENLRCKLIILIFGNLARTHPKDLAKYEQSAKNKFILRITYISVERGINVFLCD